MIMPLLGDFEVYTVYDCEQVKDAGPTTLFEVPLGMNNKNYSRTNMVKSKSLPTPERLLVSSIRMGFLNSNGCGLVPVSDPVYWNSAMRLIIGSKIYWESPVISAVDPALILSAGQGYLLMPPAQRAQIEKKLQCWLKSEPVGGAPDRGGWPRIDGLTIEPGYRFEVTVFGAQRKEPMEVFCCLDGVKLLEVI